MNVLVLTTLYPNAVQTRHGIFIEHRVRELVKRFPDVKVKVIAPVPYFPSWLPIKGYQHFGAVEQFETRHNIEIYHPRYYVIPKIGMNITPWFLYFSTLKMVNSLILNGFTIDVIDAHYYYPDGVVANWIGRKLNIPVSVTARGSDINVIPENITARKRIQKTIASVAANIGVSAALVQKIKQLQLTENPPIVLRNGVDLDLFKPSVAESELTRVKQPNEKVILSVGNLIPLKGHHLVIEALSQLPDVVLYILGDGNMREELEQLVVKLGVSERVVFTGNVNQQELIKYYSAADLLVLASSREGMPNVLLEALACGTPVVATDVGGCKEVVFDSKYGKILQNRTVEDIVHSIREILATPPKSEQVREFAQHFSWDETSTKQYHLLKHISLSKENT